MNVLNKDLTSVQLEEQKKSVTHFTSEQAAVIDTKISSGDIIKVTAYAGTGKTSTLIGLVESQPSQRFLYLAFNKSVEAEAKVKFPGNTTCKTVHALAYGAVGRRFTEIRGNISVWDIAKRLHIPLYQATLVNRTLTSWMNSADRCLSEVHVEPDILGICVQGYEAHIVSYCNTIWSDMQQGRGLCMTHSGYLKLYQLQNPYLTQYDTILLDEAQDTNPVTQDIVLSQTTRGVKVYLAGDPYQQIYAWRGAVDVMQNVQCHEFRITQSFRFGPRIAELANIILKKLFNESVPVLGLNTVLQESTNTKRTVITRTNAALFEHATTLPGYIHVVGTSQFLVYMNDLVDLHHLKCNRKHLITDVRFARAKSFTDLKTQAEDTLDIELVSKLGIVERVGSSIPDMVTSIRERLAATTSGADVTLTTTHKAKGLEWSHVVLSEDFEDFFSSSGSLKKIVRKLVKPSDETASQEEANLLYVAATRAKNVLTPNLVLRRLRKHQEVQ